MALSYYTKGMEWSMNLNSKTEIETHYYNKGKNMPRSFLLDGANWPVEKEDQSIF